MRTNCNKSAQGIEGCERAGKNGNELTRTELLSKIGASYDAEGLAYLEVMNNEDFGRWLIGFFSNEIEKQAQWLSWKFRWLATRYGEDVSPEAIMNSSFAKLLSKAHVYASYSNPLAGIRRAMYNLMCDRARQLFNYGEPVAIDQEKESHETLQVMTGPSGHARIQQNECCEVVNKLLDAVEAKRSRGVKFVRMAYFEGVSVTEIALMAGINHSNVVRDIKATLKLARKIAPSLGFAG